MKPLSLLLLSCVTLLCVACKTTSSPAPREPSANASCIEKQNYCLNVCKYEFERSDFTSAMTFLASALAVKPKKGTSLDNDPVYQQGKTAERTNKAALADCRESCDLEQEQCIRRKK